MSMYQEFMQESLCDFPGCSERFCTQKGALVALVKNGKALAFCGPHCDRVQAEGIRLRTLEDVKRELGLLTPEDDSAARRARREEQFLHSLKK